MTATPGDAQRPGGDPPPPPPPSPPPAPAGAPGAGPTKESVMEALRPVNDPELMISIVDLGLIYDVTFPEARRAEVKMTLTSPGCPIGPELMAAVDGAARHAPGVADVHVQLVWDPPWDPTKMASDEAKEKLGIW